MSPFTLGKLVSIRYLRRLCYKGFGFVTPLKAPFVDNLSRSPFAMIGERLVTSTLGELVLARNGICSEDAVYLFRSIAVSSVQPLKRSGWESC